MGKHIILNLTDDPGPALAQASQPGANRVSEPSLSEPTPDRIRVRPSRPETADDELDATRQMK